jgi:hypothetical protein
MELFKQIFTKWRKLIMLDKSTILIMSMPSSSVAEEFVKALVQALSLPIAVKKLNSLLPQDEDEMRPLGLDGLPDYDDEY